VKFVFVGSRYHTCSVSLSDLRSMINVINISSIDILKFVQCGTVGQYCLKLANEIFIAFHMTINAVRMGSRFNKKSQIIKYLYSLKVDHDSTGIKY